RQLALVERARAGDPARHDLAGLGDVAFQRAEILVINFLHALGGEAAELSAAKKSGHGAPLVWVGARLQAASSSEAESSLPRSASSRSARRGRSSSSSRRRAGRSSSSFFASGD